MQRRGLLGFASLLPSPFITDCWSSPLGATSRLSRRGNDNDNDNSRGRRNRHRLLHLASCICSPASESSPETPWGFDSIPFQSPSDHFASWFRIHFTSSSARLKLKLRPPFSLSYTLLKLNSVFVFLLPNDRPTSFVPPILDHRSSSSACDDNHPGPCVRAS